MASTNRGNRDKISAGPGRPPAYEHTADHR